MGLEEENRQLQERINQLLHELAFSNENQVCSSDSQKETPRIKGLKGLLSEREEQDDESKVGAEDSLSTDSEDCSSVCPETKSSSEIESRVISDYVSGVQEDTNSEDKTRDSFERQSEEELKGKKKKKKQSRRKKANGKKEKRKSLVPSLSLDNVSG